MMSLNRSRSHRRCGYGRSRRRGLCALRGKRKLAVERLELRTPPSESVAALIGLGGALGALDCYAGPQTRLNPGEVDEILLNSGPVASHEMVSAFESRDPLPLVLPAVPESAQRPAAPRPASAAGAPEGQLLDELLALPLEKPDRPQAEDSLVSLDLPFALAGLLDHSAMEAPLGGTAGALAAGVPAPAATAQPSGPTAANAADTGSPDAPPPRPHGAIKPLRFDSPPDTGLPRDIPPQGGFADMGPSGGMLLGEGSGGSGGGNNPPEARDDGSGGEAAAVLGKIWHVPNEDFDNILENDSDEDGDPLSVWDSDPIAPGVNPVSEPDNGKLTLNEDGSFDYTPQKIGEDEFVYRATDGIDESNEATAYFEVVLPPVDIDTDSDNNGTLDQTPEEDAVEADESGGSGGSVPGNVLHWNHDDDNGNAVEDRLEGPGPLAFDDDDLEPAVLKVDGQSASGWAADAAGGSEGLLDGVSLEINYDNTTLAVWRTRNKEVLDDDADGVVTFAFTSSGAPSGVPDEIYVEGLEPGEGTVTWKLIAPTDEEPSGEVVANDVVKFTVVDVDLTIYDGQYGDAVADDLEESRGAFTVANMNDTDGDGHIDSCDWNGVLENPKGRDEQDLMKLVLKKPTSDMDRPVTLTVPLDGVSLWEEPTKQTQIPLDDFGMASFYAADFATGDRTVWVEITPPSGSLRDIEIEMEYYGFTDTVKATAVWAELTAVEYGNADYDDLIQQQTWAPIDTTHPPKGEAQGLGGTGLRPILETGFVSNAIWMRYTVGPPGIEDVEIVKWDITRRITKKVWWLTEDRSIRNSDSKTPSPKNEEANDDDMTDSDESSQPNADGHMFVVDGPGIDQVGPGVYSPNWYWIGRFNAEEFIRVRFDGNSPEGDGWNGSRASDKFLWHARHDLERDRGGALWKRTTGDAAPVHPLNCVGTGNPPIGESP